MVLTFYFFLGVMALLIVQGIIWAVWITSRVSKTVRTSHGLQLDMQAEVADIHRQIHQLSLDMQKDIENLYRDVESLRDDSVKPA